MTRYSICHVCDPTGDLGAERPLRYLQLFQEVLALDQVFHTTRPVRLTRAWLEHEIEQNLDRHPIWEGSPRPGVVIGIGTRPWAREEMDALVAFGSEPGGVQNVDASSIGLAASIVLRRPGGTEKVRRLLVEGIEILDPFCASVQHADNCERMNEYDLSRAYRPEERPGSRPEPVLVHWQTYLRSDMVEAFGGRDHLLDTPAHAVHELDTGLIIELVTDPFDDDSHAHRETQLRTMKHLGIPSELPPGYDPYAIQ